MEIEVNIDKDKIEKQVTDAIISSAIGDQIKKSVEKALTETTGSFSDRKTLVQRCVDGVIENEVRLIVIREIQSRSDEIKKTNT